MASHTNQDEIELAADHHSDVAGGADWAITRRGFLGVTVQTSAAFIIGCLFNGKIEAFDVAPEATQF